MSLGIHLSILGVLQLASFLEQQTYNLEDKKFVEVEFVQSPNAKEKNIVMQADAPELDMLSKAQTDIMSKSWQRVKQQQRAALTGKTGNRSDNQLPVNKTQKTLNPQPQQQKAEQTAEQKNQNKEKSKSQNLADTDNSSKKASEKLNTNTQSTSEWKNPLASGKSKSLASMLKQDLKQEAQNMPRDLSKYTFYESGVSTFGESVDDNIQIGFYTALNTDKHLYYSFYERLQDRIRPLLSDKIDESLKQFYYRGSIRKIAAGSYLTRLQVILNSKGYIEKILVEKKSGLEAWDLAPVYAFQTAHPFINPPKDMIEADGKVRLYFASLIHWDPSYIPLIGRRQ